MHEISKKKKKKKSKLRVKRFARNTQLGIITFLSNLLPEFASRPRMLSRWSECKVTKCKEDTQLPGITPTSFCAESRASTSRGAKSETV
jgi:hypothetical protein